MHRFRPPRARSLAFALALVALHSPRAADAQQQSFDTVQVRTEKITDRLYVLFGAGGNIAVSVGDDGPFIVDDQFAPLSEKIRAAVAALTDKPIRFLVNTHWHGDHTGGNANFGKSGVVILAQDNVRKRMSTVQGSGQRVTPASPRVALPVVTFGEELTLHVNGDSVHAVHVPNAHTDGDALLHFVHSNAIHMGDTFFAGRYPYIDVPSGGSIEGIIAAADRALAIIDDETRVIPGHGPVSRKSDLVEYRRVMVLVRDRVKALVRQGKSLTDVAKAKPLDGIPASWGSGFMKDDAFLDIVFNDLQAKYGKQ